ncbi:MAG: class I SAM-dependent methyltransferase [bacterium]
MPPSRDERPRPSGARVFAGDAAARYDGWFETPAGRYARELENELLTRAAGDVRGVRVLDVGCGTGLHLELFAGMGARGVGLEPSPDMLQRAEERLRRWRVHLVRGRAGALPFRDRSVDLVTMVTSVEFVADARAAFAEAARVSRRRVVVAVLNAWSLSAALRRLKRNLGPTLFRAVRFYDPYELSRALTRHLKTPLEMATTLHFFPLYGRRWLWPLAAADRWLTRRGGLGGAFLVAWGDVEARKT